MLGRPSQVIARLTAANGRQIQPPSWALGPTLDRARPNIGYTPTAYASSVTSDLSTITAQHIPITAYRIEAWSGMPTATFEHFIRAFHRLGIHVLAYLNCYVAANDPRYAQVIAAGLEVRTASGAPYVVPRTNGAPAVILDFTNPATVAWWQGQVTSLLADGADGFMEDFGEQVMPDMHFANGQTGATLHNAYPVIYHQATRSALDAFQWAHPGRTVFSYVRSGYNGSARYEAGVFPGDETADWSRSSGLASLAPTMLNLAVGGAWGFTTDIGGYFASSATAPSSDLFLRWAAWSALTPYFRVHNNGLFGTRMPWDFGASTLSAYESLAALHNRALPLIEHLWSTADRTGMPIERPLWLAYPSDPRAATQNQEWMLGPDVLVAPVVTPSTSGRSVYLPAGCWQQAESGPRLRGGRNIWASSPVGTLPWFAHCGTHPI